MAFMRKTFTLENIVNAVNNLASRDDTILARKEYDLSLESTKTSMYPRITKLTKHGTQALARNVI